MQLTFKLILGIAFSAFCVNVVEFTSGIHLHTLVNYGDFQSTINDIEPTGNYGLSWTFETQSGVQRFGAFFANPLELSSASLLAFAIAFIFFMKTPYRNNQILYGSLMMIFVGSLFFAYSRASLAAFILELIFIGFMFKYYRLLWAGLTIIFSFVIYTLYFASEDMYFFVLDTLTFENASSLGHLLEWLEAIESMIDSPQGIGLAMSGNGNGVDNENRVGGENQFLIFGVQMGLLGLILYISLLYLAIKTSIQAYRKSLSPNEQIIPFVAGTTKFALLLPLFTANAELYLFVSLISWWLVGQSVKIKTAMSFHLMSYLMVKEKIILDIQYLLMAKTGIRTYIHELLAATELSKKYEYMLYPKLAYIEKPTSSKKHTKWRHLFFHLHTLFWKQLVIPFLILWHRPKAVIFPDYHAPFWNLPCEKIIVFHDIFFGRTLRTIINGG